MGARGGVMRILMRKFREMCNLRTEVRRLAAARKSRTSQPLRAHGAVYRTRMSVQPQQAAAIPFRRHGEETEFCLITTASGKWSIPKGIIDPGDTAIETALKESHEEAGLHGEVIGAPVGHYQYDKWGTTLTVEVYLMEVKREDDEWEEKAVRQRRWVTGPAALELVGSHPVRVVLEQAVTLVGG